MLFTSVFFIFVFLPITIIVSRRLKGTALLAWIGLVSAVFYANAGETWFLIPMFAITILDYFIAILLDRTENPHARRMLLIFSLCGSLGTLAYFKYSRFILNSLSHLMSNPSSWLSTVLLPAGI